VSRLLRAVGWRVKLARCILGRKNACRYANRSAKDRRGVPAGV
jgi:hypothetical protein